jgi:biopolymer transport protein ExbB/TolQ
MGTVIGFIYVLIYLDTNALKSIETLPVALEHISKGLGIALYTTLVGTFFNVWMIFNFIYLNKEVEKLILKYSLLFEKSNNHSTT